MKKNEFCELPTGSSKESCMTSVVVSFLAASLCSRSGKGKISEYKSNCLRPKPRQHQQDLEFKLTWKEIMLILKMQMWVNKHICFYLKTEPLICLSSLCCLIDQSGWFDLTVFLACDLSSSRFLFLKLLEHIRNQFATFFSYCRSLLQYLLLF